MFLISACLCGVNCKYNGLNNYNEKCSQLLKEGKAILICPEQLGGLSTPRIASELQGSAKDILDNKGKVINKIGDDVTVEFLNGVNEVKKIIEKVPINIAILKDGSPSCGVNYVYDGTFTGNKINGRGLTAEMLSKMGIKLLSEKDMEVIK